MGNLGNGESGKWGIWEMDNLGNGESGNWGIGELENRRIGNVERESLKGGTS